MGKKEFKFNESPEDFRKEVEKIKREVRRQQLDKMLEEPLVG